MGGNTHTNSINDLPTSPVISEMIVFGYILILLKDGAFFGELALISKKPRAATIHCVTDCYIATLDRRSFNIIQNVHEKLLNKKVEQIKNILSFQNLSRTALLKYQNYFVPKDFSRGQYAQVEG